MKTRDFESVLWELDETGSFIGYASVYDVVDTAGDVLVQGALAHTECPLPLLYGHVNHESPIGQVVACLDDEYGLLIEGRIDLHSEKGRAVYSLMKKGTLHALSIGFYANKSRNNIHGGFDIFDASLCEVSVVLVPANEQAQILRVKAGEPTEATEEPGEPTEATEATEEPGEPTEATEEPTEATEEPGEPTEATEATEEPTEATEATEEPTEATEEPGEPTEATEETFAGQPAKKTRDYTLEAKSRIAIAIQKHSRR